LSEVESAVWAASFSRLTALSELTSLQLTMLDVSFGADVGDALASLTGLRDLRIDTLDSEDVPAMEQLTGCKQLTKLYVETLGGPFEEGVLITNEVGMVAQGMVSSKDQLCHVNGLAATWPAQLLVVCKHA
jgi:hypothetical protein